MGSGEVPVPEKALTENAAQDAPPEQPLWPSIARLVRENPEDVPKGSKPASPTGVQMGRSQTESGVVWITAIFMAIFHLGAIAALFFFSWTNLIVAAVLYILAVNCGIGMGYHRLLVHRGYQVPKVVEYFFTVCGTLALEGGPIAWVATHRIHHRHSDHLGDPHTPREGTWWAHMGWIITGRALNSQTAALAHYAPDLARDRVQVWLSKYHWVPLTILGIGLLVVGTLLMGHIPARYSRSPRHMARELCDPSQRGTALSNPGLISQQLVGGAAYGGRGLAQQSPRESGFSPARSRMV
jgi:hypothetical protein